MGSCYSGDHLARDDIHSDIKICHIEEPQPKYLLRMVSIKLLGVGVGA